MRCGESSSSASSAGSTPVAVATGVEPAEDAEDELSPQRISA